MDSDDKAPRQDLMRRLFQRSAWRIALFLLLILLAYIAPRLYLYRGVEMTSAFKFVDMSMHLVNLDLLQKNRGLSVDQLKDPFIAAFPEVAQRKIGIRWPAGAYSIASHGARIWGPLSIWTTQLTTFLFTMILVAGVIFMGRAMGSLRVGLWGGLFTVLCPPLVASTWYFSLDYCMGAMVLVGLYLLYQTRGFTSPAYSLAFALWCSFGMNVKTSYGLYFVVPALLALILGRRSAPDQVPLKRVLLMAVGAFFLSVATFLGATSTIPHQKKLVILSV